MTYEVYIDVILIVNGVMDGILLAILNRILGAGAKAGRIFLGAAAGAMWACAAALVPAMPLWLRFLGSCLAVPALMVWIAFRPRGVKQMVQAAAGLDLTAAAAGGVTEAVLRRVTNDKSQTMLRQIAMTGVRGYDGVKEFTVPYGDGELKIGVVSGLANAEKVIKRVKAGEHFDLIEVMSCPGGCINGAGQPFAAPERKRARGKELYNSDKLCTMKRSEENMLMMSLYSGVLKGKVHELLHVDYVKAKER